MGKQLQRTRRSSSEHWRACRLTDSPTVWSCRTDYVQRSASAAAALSYPSTNDVVMPRRVDYSLSTTATTYRSYQQNVVVDWQLTGATPTMYCMAVLLLSADGGRAGTSIRWLARATRRCKSTRGCGNAPCCRRPLHVFSIRPASTIVERTVARYGRGPERFGTSDATTLLGTVPPSIRSPLLTQRETEWSILC